jgi:acyl-CoA synthetase (AMP-forming)/AMP-acid ligase II
VRVVPTSWNFADVFATVAATQPDAVAIRQGDRTETYGELLGRVDALGTALAADRPLQDKVGVYLYNCPESLETSMAALYARLVPVNTNYRYGDDELEYLWGNADCTSVVFHGSFTDRVDGLRARCPKVRTWVHVDDATAPCPSWAVPYESLATPAGPPRTVERSGEDLLLLYTGGTTGIPKGVMWAQDGLFRRLNAGGIRRFDLEGTLEDVAAKVAEEGPGARVLPACPLMHGTGLFSSIETLAEGGEVVLLASRRFDAEELADTIERTATAVAVIVGDPFARPLLDALRAGRPERIASLSAIISSGAMWSEEVKRGLLDFNRGLMLIDAFSSSEALGMGTSVTVADATAHTAQFSLGEGVRVLGEDGTDVEPGSDTAGLLALPGTLPLGYYKDEAKTDATFRTIDSVRYSIPGDWAKVAADGTIQLLGRGSQCINTAGEKVFPEEVEEALKTHPDVRDACVLGVPDERYGEVVMAVVEPTDGRALDESTLIDHVRSQLAHYKAPRRVRTVPTIGRTPAGKMDYARNRTELQEWLAAAPG